MSLVNKLNVNLFAIIFIFLFALLTNQYFGNRGVFPIDSFSHYDTGFRVLNGEFPFKDYWTVSGPFVDFIQAFIFSIFGDSWQAYLLNGSLVNAIFALLSYKLITKLGLETKFALFYSLCIAVLAYPVSSTPFVDLHSTYFSIFAIYFYLFALITKKNIYWFFLPVLVFCSFLSKQVPAVYIFLGILLILIYNFTNKDFKKNLTIFKILIFSSLTCFVTFFLILNLCQINFEDFIYQYIGFPREIGGNRYFSLNYDFKNLFLDFKLIHLIFFTYVSLILYQLKNKKKFKTSTNFIVFLFALLILISLIQHQLLTKNQIYIFFLIPLFSSFTHVEINNLFKNKKNYLKYTLVVICLVSVFKYNERFNIERKFHELNYVKFSDSVDSKMIDAKLGGLNWITPGKESKDSINKEIQSINDILKTLRNNKDNNLVITNYSIFSVILEKSQNGISRWYPGNNSNFPRNTSKYFTIYKNFFISNIIRKEIKNIYVLFDVDESNVTNYLPANCLIKELSNNLFVKFKVKEKCLEKIDG